MAEYRVTCDRCGKSFHAEIEGYYSRKTQQYICPHCGATSRGNYCEYCGSAF